MNFRAIIIGDEILRGKRADRHFAKMVELLSARGLYLSRAEYCGDDRAGLVEVLRRSFADGGAVFCFGGIGSTPDDNTRQAAAEALGLNLALHPDAVALIEAAMQRRYGRAASPQQLHGRRARHRQSASARRCPPPARRAGRGRRSKPAVPR